MTTPATTQTFSTTLFSNGGNNVAIVVPDEVVDSFAHGKRVPVIVHVDGDYSYRGSIAVMGGRYLISFNAAVRAATNKRAGDVIQVRLDLDDAPRTVAVPPELATELARDPDAAAAWDRLSYSRKKAHALSLDEARTAQTRERRIANIVNSLKPST
jgi:Domain of unknown function (DUF1905)/Bacteriocin-protection, YdeI or OmpD-Associated